MHPSSILFPDLGGCKAVDEWVIQESLQGTKGAVSFPKNNNISGWALGIPPGWWHCRLGLLEDCVASELVSLTFLYRINNLLFYVFTGEAASKGERFRC